MDTVKEFCYLGEKIYVYAENYAINASSIRILAF